MPTLPITGVTLGNTFNTGLPNVHNSADNLTPVGFSSSQVSGNALLYDPTYANAYCEFAFIGDYSHPSTLNVPFSFGSINHPIAATGGLDATLFGASNIQNSAKDASPEGIDSLAPGYCRIWHLVDGGGGDINFFFNTQYNKQSPLNTPFYFGAGLVINGVTLGDTSKFGLFLLEQPLQILPEGLLVDFKMGSPRVGDQPDVNFEFIDSYTPSNPLNTPFYFGGNLPISATLGKNDSSFGLSAILNSAKSATPKGLSHTVFGRAAAYFSDSNGYGVDFTFTQSYNPGQGVGQYPNTLNIPFYFAGIQSLQLGSIADLAFGLPSLEGVIQIIEAIGLEALTVSNPILTNPAPLQSIGGVGFDSLDVGNILTNETQYIPIEGVSSNTIFGSEAFISHYLRYIDVVNVDYTGSIVSDSAWVSNFIRYASPEGICSWVYLFDNLGIPSVELTTKVITHVSPSTSSVISRNLTIGSNTQFIDYVSVNSLINHHPLSVLSPDASIYGLNQYILPQHINSQVMGENSNIWLSTTYVFPEWIYDINAYPNEQVQFPKFGNAKPYNRNRHIYPSGIHKWDYFTWGDAYLHNDAKLIFPPSIYQEAVLQKWDSNLFVSYLIRKLQPVGLDATQFTDWVYPIIKNTAHVIDIGSIDSLEVSGYTKIYDPTKYIKVHSSESSLYGFPWVSHSPRYLNVAFKGINSFKSSDLAWISNLTRYISPLESLSTLFGNTEIYEHFNIIGVRPYTDYTFFGQSIVKNVTPQIYARSIFSGSSDAFGSGTFISYAIRYISFNFSNSISPTSYVSTELSVLHRDRTIEIAGIMSEKISRQALIYLSNPPTDFPQFIYPDLIENNPGAPQKEPIGVPYVRGPVLPVGFSHTAFGNPEMHINTIEAVWRYPSSLLNFGKPSIQKTLYIAPSSIEPLKTFAEDTHLWPHTIWCTPDVPVVRPEDKVWHAIDHGYPNGVKYYGDAIGTAIVYFPGIAQYVKPQGISTNINKPNPAHNVVNKTHEVFISTPKVSSKFGYPTLPYTKKVYTVSIGETFGGLTNVELLQEYVPNPFPQYINANSIDSYSPGLTYIELFNKNVYPTGFDSDIFGNNNPMIHYPRTVTPEPFDSDVFGNLYIDFYRRSFNIEGFDSLDMTYDSYNFNGILRVKHLNFRVNTPGIGPDTNFGLLSISNAQQFISVYQIANPRCLGGRPTVTQA